MHHVCSDLDADQPAQRFFSGDQFNHADQDNLKSERHRQAKSYRSLNAVTLSRRVRLGIPESEEPEVGDRRLAAGPSRIVHVSS